jgi:cyclopropane fatty-acyl-phospholipid synthase-like methyltransferase
MRRLYFLPIDAVDRVLGRRGVMIPRKSEIFTGSVDDFLASGNALADRLIEFGCLTPQSKVLDVGCGMGRLAVALTSRLGPDGSYDGLDIVPAGVKWCERNIAPNHAGFHFTLADIRNKEYSTLRMWFWPRSGN